MLCLWLALARLLLWSIICSYYPGVGSLRRSSSDRGTGSTSLRSSHAVFVTGSCSAPALINYLFVLPWCGQFASFFVGPWYWIHFILSHVIPFAVVLSGNCAIVFKIVASKRLRDVAANDDKGSRKIEHFSRVNFYCLRIYFRLAVMRYRSIHCTSPSCLQSCFNRVSDMTSRRRLQSSTSHRLDVPPVRLSTVGRRAFSVSGATVWNGLPLHVASAPSLAV